MDYIDRKVDHPEFVRCAIGAAPFVFVFDRGRYKKPSEEQLEQYNRNRDIVEAHGGRMLDNDYQIAGENDVYTKKEVDALVALVSDAHKDLEFDFKWNGAGCYTVSLGFRKRQSQSANVKSRKRQATAQKSANTKRTNS